MRGSCCRRWRFPFSTAKARRQDLPGCVPTARRTGRTRGPARRRSGSTSSRRAWRSAPLSPRRLAPARRPGPADHIYVEGEKKAAKGVQEGFCCIGLCGIACWSEAEDQTTRAARRTGRAAPARGQAGLCRLRREDNPDVEREQIKFAAALRAAGTLVKLIRLPKSDDGSKVGLDDFLVAKGTDGRVAEVDGGGRGAAQVRPDRPGEDRPDTRRRG